MLKRICRSIKLINYKLFVALLFLGLVPTVYTTVRTFFLGQIPNEWAFSIAGQLTWVNLLYEILNEAIILPLFYLIGKVKEDQDTFSNRIKTGMIFCLVLYLLLSISVFGFAKPLLSLMAADKMILDASAQYIRIESIANVFGILMQFALVALVMVNKSAYLYIFTVVRLVLCLITDMLLISSMPFSLNLGVNGIGYSNIIVNVVLVVCAVALLSREGMMNHKAPLNFCWLKELLQIGGISGLESLVRNVAYMVLIARMVNMVGEQGAYWVANNFIWGWLLLPILQFGELIKQEIATEPSKIKVNTLGYFIITALIVILWFVSIPLWKPFMKIYLGLAETEKIFQIVLMLVGFYVLFAFQNVFDSTFYGLGKTNYMLFESIVTNTVYYGGAFVLYMVKIWTPTLTSIILLFGIGTAFDSIVSLFAYIHLLRTKKINIWK